MAKATESGQRIERRSNTLPTLDTVRKLPLSFLHDSIMRGHAIRPNVMNNLDDGQINTVDGLQSYQNGKRGVSVGGQ